MNQARGQRIEEGYVQLREFEQQRGA